MAADGLTSRITQALLACVDSVRLAPAPSISAIVLRIEALRAVLRSTWRSLAEFHAELIEAVDLHENAVGEGAVLVESDERAQRRRREIVDQDRRAGPIAGIGARSAAFSLPRMRAAPCAKQLTSSVA